MGFKVTFTEEDFDHGDDQRAEPGFYLAEISSYERDEKGLSEKLAASITGPLFIGKTYSDTLWDPDFASDEKQKTDAIRKLVSYAKRFGLIAKTDSGKEVDIDLSVLIGRKVVMHLIEKPGTSRSGTPTTYTNCAFLGLYPLEHESIKAETRIKLGLPLLAGQIAPGSCAAPQTEGKPANKRGRPAKAANGPTEAPIDLEKAGLINF